MDTSDEYLAKRREAARLGMAALRRRRGLKRKFIPDQPWREEGVSRATWFRRRKAAEAKKAETTPDYIDGIYGRTLTAALPPHPDRMTRNLVARLAAIGSTEATLVWKKTFTSTGRFIYHLAPGPCHPGRAYWRTPKASGGGFPKLGTSLTGQRAPDDPLKTRGTISVAFQAQHLVYGGPEGVARARRDKLPLHLNPWFLSWLMTCPDAWTASVLKATASYRRPVRRRSPRNEAR